MITNTVCVVNLVKAITSITKRHKQKTTIQRALRFPLSSKDTISAGIDIHNYVDPYIKEPVIIYTEQDMRAIKLLNLITKLTRLQENKEENELEIRVPWNLLLGLENDEGAKEMVVVGILDCLQVNERQMTVVELKTHNSVDWEGKPVLDKNILDSHRKQVLLYALMFLYRFSG